MCVVRQFGIVKKNAKQRIGGTGTKLIVKESQSVFKTGDYNPAKIFVVFFMSGIITKQTDHPFASAFRNDLHLFINFFSAESFHISNYSS